jgi:thioredoxin-related protein
MKKLSIITGVLFVSLSAQACTNSTIVSAPDNKAISASMVADSPVDTTTKVSTASVSNLSTELVWYSFEEGYTKAVKEGKIILVDAYTDWCGWCKVMDKKTYTDAAVIQKLNADFVCVKLNPEVPKTYAFANKKMQSTELLQWLGNGQVSGFPTTIFWLSPGKDEKRYAQPGYLPPTEFSNLLDMALAAKKK